MKYIILSILMLLSSNSFGAGTTPSQQTGIIKSIQALNDGRIIVFMLDNRTDKPDCATFTYWFIADENSTAGKTQTSILLTAHSAKRKISIKGTGLCTRWVDGEDISSIEMLE